MVLDLPVDLTQLGDDVGVILEIFELTPDCLLDVILERQITRARTAVDILNNQLAESSGELL